MRAKYSQRKRRVGEGIKKWQMQSRKNSNIYYRFFLLCNDNLNHYKHDCFNIVKNNNVERIWHNDPIY
jgi:hypothetical protein